MMEESSYKSFPKEPSFSRKLPDTTGMRYCYEASREGSPEGSGKKHITEYSNRVVSLNPAFWSICRDYRGRSSLSSDSIMNSLHHSLQDSSGWGEVCGNVEKTGVTRKFTGVEMAGGGGLLRLLGYTPNRATVEAIVATCGIDGRRIEGQAVHIAASAPRRRPVVTVGPLIVRRTTGEVASERKAEILLKFGGASGRGGDGICSS